MKESGHKTTHSKALEISQESHFIVHQQPEILHAFVLIASVQSTMAGYSRRVIQCWLVFALSSRFVELQSGSESIKICNAFHSSVVFVTDSHKISKILGIVTTPIIFMESNVCTVICGLTWVILTQT